MRSIQELLIVAKGIEAEKRPEGWSKERVEDIKEAKEHVQLFANDFIHGVLAVLGTVAVGFAVLAVVGLGVIVASLAISEGAVAAATLTSLVFFGFCWVLGSVYGHAVEDLEHKVSKDQYMERGRKNGEDPMDTSHKWLQVRYH